MVYTIYPQRRIVHSRCEMGHQHMESFDKLILRYCQRPKILHRVHAGDQPLNLGIVKIEWPDSMRERVAKLSHYLQIIPRLRTYHSERVSGFNFC